MFVRLWFLLGTVCVVYSAHYSIIPSYITSRVCAPPLGDTCINIRRCQFFTELLDKTPIPRPRSIISIIVRHQCGMEGDDPKVCCFLQGRDSVTIPPTTPRPTQHPTTEPVEPSFTDFVENPKIQQLTDHPNYNLLPRERCGPIRTQKLSNRITFGKRAALEEFPWMGLIAYNSTDMGIEFRCSGTIIHHSYILTAAHCILNSTLLGVRLGEYDLNSHKEDCDGPYCSPPVQDFYITSTIIHPKYNPRTHENDIALLRLSGNANFTYSNIQPICLPVSEINDDLTGKSAVVSGWGLTETEHMSSVPLKTSVPVLPITTCAKIYEGHVPITRNQICAGGYKGRDSCSGDSGGPLMYFGMMDGNPRYVQYGIVSFGPKKCGAEGQPGIYTRVMSYIGWILDNIESS